MQEGDTGASEALARVVYDELHRLASHLLRRERAEHTLQPTALVHDAYLRLVGQRDTQWQGRSHFFGIAAQAMRRLLVDHARHRSARKRDGGERVTLDEGLLEVPGRSLELLALDDALVKLAEQHPRAARVVELRFFAGLDIEPAAEALGVSRATANRDWMFARAFLQRELDAA